MKDSKDRKTIHGGEKANSSKTASKGHNEQLLQISRFRLWLFRSIAVLVFPVLFLVIFEFALRLVGYGYNPSAIVECKLNNEPAYCDNVKFSWRFFPPAIARECDPFAFKAEKPEKTYRICVLGASAVKGEPDGALSFSRMLKVMLDRCYPDVNFEVVNLGMAAINSHVVLQIAKDCSILSPDLFIVYLGNNEVTGPYGAGTTFAPLSKNISFIRANIALKGTRLGQLIKNLIERVRSQRQKPVTWHGLRMFLDKQIRANDPRLNIVYGHFKRNLEDIVNVANENGARILLCTVGSNLKDCPPFASLHNPDLTDAEEQKWQTVYNRGIAEEKEKKYEEAVGYYLAVIEMDSDYADVHFRLGRCYWAMKQYDKALESYSKARELDTLRFRADDSINRVIREVAQQKARQGVLLVDTVEVFAENSPQRTAGDELFYEHVHMNFHGAYLLSLAIFDKVEKLVTLDPAIIRKDSVAIPDEYYCAEHLGYNLWNQVGNVREILGGFIKRPPFTNQLYHEEQVIKMEQHLQQIHSQLTPDLLGQTAKKYISLIEQNSNDWWLRWKYGKLLTEDIKDYSSALREYLVVQDILPHSYIVHDALGSVYRGMRNFDNAIEQYNEAVRIKPTNSESYYYLGLIYQNNDNPGKAIESYKQAIKWKGDYLQAYNNLAEIYMRQGKLTKAIEVCRTGLDVLPESGLLRSNFGVLLDMTGKHAEGLAEVRKALELEPNSPQILKIFQKLKQKAG